MQEDPESSVLPPIMCQVKTQGEKILKKVKKTNPQSFFNLMQLIKTKRTR